MAKFHYYPDNVESNTFDGRIINEKYFHILI